MLSATNTITDMKTKLRNGFAFFGFADDTAFVSALEESVDNNKRELMYPALGTIQTNDLGTSSTTLLATSYHTNNLSAGKAVYDNIALKDKTNLNIFEEYIYWAEIWFSMADFISNINDDELFYRTGGNQTITTEGYSSSVSGDVGSTGKDDMISKFYNKGNSYFVQAGIHMNSMYRGGR